MDISLGWPDWIGVVVDDLAGARTFWGDVLGLEVDHEGDDYVSFRTPDGRWFEVIERSQDPEYDARRFQVAFAVDDLERAVEDLEARGVERIAGPYVEHPEPWAYFRDREGNVFGVKQRRS